MGCGLRVYVSVSDDLTIAYMYVWCEVVSHNVS